MTKVLLVEPVLTDRETFKSCIKGSVFTVVKECTNGDEAVAAFRALKPDLVVACIITPGHRDRPGDGGINVIKRLLAEDTKAKVVSTFTQDTQYLLMTAIGAGAVNKLRKPFQTGAIMEALGKAELVKSGAQAMKQAGVRLKKSLVVHFKKASDGMLSRMRDVVSDDVSPNGIGMKTTERLPEHTQLKLEIELPGIRTIKALGVVVHAKTEPGLNLHTIGIGFTQMDEKDRETLKQFILQTVAKGK
jgi:two-component system chemotaxis response regulator CheY